MGAVCSLEDQDDEEQQQQQQQQAGKPAVYPSHHHNPSATSTSSAFAPTSKTYRDELPRDVVLQRLWTSVVVGELVKHHTVSLYDESMSVLAVVQGMMKSGANYAIIRQTPSAAVTAGPAASQQPSSAVTGGQARPIATGASNASSGPPRTFRTARRQRDTYIGLFDWRDLNALLVAVCKLNRLHAGQPSTPGHRSDAADKDATQQQHGQPHRGGYQWRGQPQTAAGQPRGSRDSIGLAATAAPSDSWRTSDSFSHPSLTRRDQQARHSAHRHRLTQPAASLTQPWLGLRAYNLRAIITHNRIAVRLNRLSHPILRSSHLHVLRLDHLSCLH